MVFASGPVDAGRGRVRQILLQSKTVGAREVAFRALARTRLNAMIEPARVRARG